MLRIREEEKALLRVPVCLLVANPSSDLFLLQQQQQHIFPSFCDSPYF